MRNFSTVVTHPDYCVGRIKSEELTAIYRGSKKNEFHFKKSFMDLKGKTAAFLCTRRVVPGMKAAKRGTIVNVASLILSMIELPDDMLPDQIVVRSL